MTQELKDYIEVRRYLDTNKNRKVKIYLDSEDIKYLIINNKGSIIDTGEKIIYSKTVTLKDGTTVKKEEVAGKEQTTFFNSDIDIKTLNIGEEPLVRHRGAKDEVTPWVNIISPITKIQIYV